MTKPVEVLQGGVRSGGLGGGRLDGEQTSAQKSCKTNFFIGFR